MDTPHWISFAALLVAFASFWLNVVIYRNNKRKADETRIVELESSVGKKIKDIGDQLGERLRDDLDEFETRLDTHHGKISALEQRAADAPNHDDLSDLHEKINEVNDGVSGLRGEFKGVERLLTTIHEHLLKVGK